MIFEGTLDAAQTFRGKRLRVNLGKRDVQRQANGKHVDGHARARIRSGSSSRRAGRRELPLGERPCA